MTIKALMVAIFGGMYSQVINRIRYWVHGES